MPYAVVQLPVYAVGIILLIELGVRFYSGASLIFDEDLGSLFRFAAAAAVPGAVAAVLRMAGRLELVDALPKPGAREDPAPSTLSIPTEAGGVLRPAELPRPPAPPRRRRDGVLFAVGLGCLGLATVMMVFQTESFGAVFGVKLGGVWFRGTYWNRWWFIFYGLAGVGAAALGSSLALFTIRSNRDGE